MIAPRICSECQTSNPPQAAFCFGCGKSLKQVNVTPELLQQRYHLLHKLGTGGFGAVYQAQDIQLGKRLVAIKEMSSQSNLSAQENTETTEAFKQEAFMLADRSTGRYLSITIWESEEAQLRNASSSGQVKGRQAMTEKFFEQPPTPSTFEVVAVVK